jgi:hypothetical protein
MMRMSFGGGDSDEEKSDEEDEEEEKEEDSVPENDEGDFAGSDDPGDEDSKPPTWSQKAKKAKKAGKAVREGKSGKFKRRPGADPEYEAVSASASANAYAVPTGAGSLAAAQNVARVLMKVAASGGHGIRMAGGWGVARTGNVAAAEWQTQHAASMAAVAAASNIRNDTKALLFGNGSACGTTIRYPKGAIHPGNVKHASTDALRPTAREMRRAELDMQNQFGYGGPMD